MRAVLILNPVAGISMMAEKAKSAIENEDAILKTLRSYELEPELYYTTVEDEGRGIATRSAEEGVDLVIAAGGDGTIHSVAEGLIGTESTLGIIPVGTMNNLARSLGIPYTVEEACKIIATGETHAIDVGKINDRSFLEVAGVGLEAALFPAAEDIKRPGLLSTLRGAFNALKTLIGFRPSKIRIVFDGERKQHSYNTLQITISNAPFYGMHFQLAKSARLDDGLLDVMPYRNCGKLEYLRHAFTCSRGGNIFRPRFKLQRARTLHIATDEPVEIHADGIPQGHTPATVTIMPGALRVRIPKAIKKTSQKAAEQPVVIREMLGAAGGTAAKE